MVLLLVTRVRFHTSVILVDKCPALFLTDLPSRGGIGQNTRNTGGFLDSTIANFVNANISSYFDHQLLSGITGRRLSINDTKPLRILESSFSNDVHHRRRVLHASHRLTKGRRSYSP